MGDYITEREILELADDLSCIDIRFRMNAVLKLYEAAKKRIDINSAADALEKNLDYPNPKFLEISTWTLTLHYLNREEDRKIKGLLNHTDEDVRWNASWFLTKHYIRKKRRRRIEEMLTNTDRDIRLGALDAIREAFENETNISSVIPALANSLAGNIKEDAVQLLKGAALKRVDISEAVPDLGRALKDDDIKETALEVLYRVVYDGGDISEAIPNMGRVLWDADIRETTMVIIELAASKGHKINRITSKLEDMLSNINDMMRTSAAGIFFNAAKSGQDISFSIPPLEQSLRDWNFMVRMTSSAALTLIYLKRKQWGNISELLKHENKSVRMGSASLGIREYVKNLIKKRRYTSALYLIEDSMRIVTKAYEGKTELEGEKRGILFFLAEFEQQIHDKMSPDKKTFHKPKRDEVKPVRKQVVHNGR